VDRKSPYSLAAALLLIGAWRHFGWALFDGSTRALVSKASGALAICCLLLILWRECGTKPVLPIMLWWAWEELQVMLCSTWFMFDPWPVEPGQAMCSAKLGFDIGALGILAVAILTFHLTIKVDSSTDTQGIRK
jgi:hypothetical protein